jgi:trimeric autotransporter adhesin
LLRAAPPTTGSSADDDGDDSSDATEGEEEEQDPRLRPAPPDDDVLFASPEPWASLSLSASIYAANASLAGAAGAALRSTAAASASASASASAAAASPDATAAALLSTLAHGGQLAATVALLRWLGGVEWTGAVVVAQVPQPREAGGAGGAGARGGAAAANSQAPPPLAAPAAAAAPPPRWWRFEWGAWPVVQGVSAAVVALGVGALVATSSQGAEADGALEWRELLRTAAATAASASSASSDGGGGGGAQAAGGAEAAEAAGAAAVAFVRFFGAVALAPAWEELYCRGLLVAAARPLLGEVGAATGAAVAFAAFLHPASQFPQQLSLGLVLSFASLAARGNLAVPFLGHALYNAGVLAAGAAVAAAAAVGPGAMDAGAG